MLERLTANEIGIIRYFRGPVSKVNPNAPLFISTLAPGTIIRARTKSGNTYLLEVTDSKNGLAHVVRCDSRPMAMNTGYLGERRLGSTRMLSGGGLLDGAISVGELIVHGDENTSCVAELELIPRDLPMV